MHRWLFCICLLHAFASTWCDFVYLFGLASRLQIPKWKSLRLPAHAIAHGKLSLSLLSYRKAHSDSTVWLKTAQFSKQLGAVASKDAVAAFNHTTLQAVNIHYIQGSNNTCWLVKNIDSWITWKAWQLLQHVAIEQNKQPTKTTTRCVLTHRLWLSVLICTVAMMPDNLARSNANLMHCGNDAR